MEKSFIVGFAIRGLDAVDITLFVVKDLDNSYELSQYSPSIELITRTILPYSKDELKYIEDIEVDNNILYIIYYGKTIKRFDLQNQKVLSDIPYPIKEMGGMYVTECFIVQMMTDGLLRQRL